MFEKFPKKIVTLVGALGVAAAVEAQSIDTPKEESGAEKKIEAVQQAEQDSNTLQLGSESFQKVEEVRRNMLTERPDGIEDSMIRPVDSSLVELDDRYSNFVVTRSNGRGGWMPKSTGAYADSIDITKYPDGWYHVILNKPGENLQVEKDSISFYFIKGKETFKPTN